MDPGAKLGGRASGKGCVGPRLDRPFGVRQTDPEEFGISVADRGSDFEEGTRPSLHKLVGYWSRTPDEPEAGRNQLGQRRASGKGRAGPRLDRPFGVRQTDPEEFGVSVADRGSDFEEGTRPSLHKLVGYLMSPRQGETSRN
ncbi:hypothetical protein Bca4012_063994 [Brassica carinata]|uniref:Uncharacterized protein n=1 Tax=Brassica carinata TaxID=52824 RepID=A0A8X7SCZ0_BRACI|nr:hypothetical protein Bca52824_033500 [Brassica carinata]